MSTETPGNHKNHRLRVWLWRLTLPLAVIACAALTVAVLLLRENIAQRKAEGLQAVQWVVPLDETTVDPETWGRNFPRQYDSYQRTVDTERTRHGGSEAFQRIDEFPRWKKIFSGYAFGVDYREDRGHAYMLSDQRETERVKIVNQPGACLHCHASNVVAYREVGIEQGAPGKITDALMSEEGHAQLMKGFEHANALPYSEVTQRVEHPVSCIDCHDPGNLAIRITKPAFMEGIVALAKSDEPLPHLPSIERWRKGDRAQDYDANVLATRQEMRSLVCAQCHVEYHFKGEKKRLTYPWVHGLNVEDAENYYDDLGFKDWTHKVSGAPALKAQHPEFELWSMGVHARSGVACADCHMPYKREGAMKISDHHVRSPMLNTARACQTCHAVPEEELKQRVTTIQDRTRHTMDRAEIAVVALIEEIAAAATAGRDEAILNEARTYQRQAQWRLDYIAAENSMGFHADQEAMRILADAIDLAQQGRLVLAKEPATAVAATAAR
jgi:nitrite reductase (cytochrome c-552)